MIYRTDGDRVIKPALLCMNNSKSFGASYIDVMHAYYVKDGHLHSAIPSSNRGIAYENLDTTALAHASYNQGNYTRWSVDSVATMDYSFPTTDFAYAISDHGRINSNLSGYFVSLESPDSIRKTVKCYCFTTANVQELIALGYSKIYVNYIQILKSPHIFDEEDGFDKAIIFTGLPGSLSSTSKVTTTDYRYTNNFVVRTCRLGINLSTWSSTGVSFSSLGIPVWDLNSTGYYTTHVSLNGFGIDYE